MKTSILIPIYNEEGNLQALYQKVKAACERLQLPYEIIMIDDGSSDSSFEIISKIAAADTALKVIRFRRNFGQTSAISAGLRVCSGDVIIMMDGDLQNDPDDIPLLLTKINEGYDVVSGWRKDRKDAFLSRRLPSIIANRLISALTRVHLNDYGCTLKAYRREVIKNVRLYGEMHRFLPFLASLGGARICEVVVNHHERKSGISKYGIGRTFKVILDLLTLRFLGFYSKSPIYFYGGIGGFSVVLGIIAAGVSVYQKFALGVYVHRNPLILLATFLALGGLQFIVLGLLAEILLRTYHESQDKPTYVIRDLVNLNEAVLSPDFSKKKAS